MRSTFTTLKLQTSGSKHQQISEKKQEDIVKSTANNRVLHTLRQKCQKTNGSVYGHRSYSYCVTFERSLSVGASDNGYGTNRRSDSQTYISKVNWKEDNIRTNKKKVLRNTQECQISKVPVSYFKLEEKVREVTVKQQYIFNI